MWGFYNSKNRQLANELFNRIVDPEISYKYNKVKNQKGKDQEFLSRHVYPILKKQSVIHDSYLCKNYKDSEPFPTQRIGNCFVGRVGNCNSTATDFYQCPRECRPENHQEWLNC